MTEDAKQRTGDRGAKIADGCQPSPIGLQPSAFGSPSSVLCPPSSVLRPPAVALLTGGGDKPYALGLVSALMAQGVVCDFIGSDEVDSPDLHGTPLVNFLNLRGDTSANAKFFRKSLRLLVYYKRILGYAVTARPKIFHLLWHNKFLFLDRTLVMGFYKLLGKRLVFTAHNVNAGKRDGNDSLWNRISLRSEYHLADHIFVHTDAMKRELIGEFNVADTKVTVIPFGINNTLPTSGVTKAEARERLKIGPGDKTVLFFGNIAPYKGVKYLAEAMAKLIGRDRSFRLVIAGRTKGSEEYWAGIRDEMERAGIRDRVIEKIEYIPDEDVEIYFKAADLLVLPYTHVFQSGVLFLGYSFGLPVLASDVGSLKEEILPGRTGLVCEPRDAAALAKSIATYFTSDLYRDLEVRRHDIRKFANDRYSWTTVGEMTRRVYEQLLNKQPRKKSAFGIFAKKERWGLSWRGRLLMLVIMVSTFVLLLTGIYPFLALTQRANAKVLVVEGWVHDYGIRAGVKEFNTGTYLQVFTTGGPVTGIGGYVNDQNTSASVGADLLKRAGLPDESVQMVPSHVSGRDRTYSSALALKEWFRDHNISVRAINVLTEEAHARRTRLLFQKAFGDEVTVGIISVPSPDYDAKHWWRYSEGVREVLGETIAYIYAKFFFIKPDGDGGRRTEDR